MIFDELTLHDFGVYAGQQTVKLTPSSPNKPVILFCGLNGCGKTTILEALQIALFGEQAPFLEGHNFNQYISQRINKKSRHGQASLRLDFHRSENGKLARYRIYRVWKQNISGLKESLEVIKDGHKSKFLSSKWSEHVEEIISARLAHFFFFDGEKIEEYASEAGAQQLISTGLHRLLGLDLIAKSTQDLAVLKRRKLSQSIDANPDDDLKKEIEQNQANLKQIEGEKEKLVTERARIQTHEIDKYQREIDEFNRKYKSLGKDLWEMREEIRNTLIEKKAEKNNNDGLIREVISGVLPLFLLRDDFTELEQYKKDTEDEKINTIRLSVMKDIDQKIAEFAKERKTDSELAKTLSDYLNAQYQSLLSQKVSVSFTNEGELDGFKRDTLEHELQDAKALLANYIENGKDIDEQINELIAEEESSPDSEEIKELIQQQAEINAKLVTSEKHLDKLNDELSSIKTKLDKIKSQIDALSRQALELNIEGEKQKRYVTRIDSANLTLQSFSKKIIKGKIKHIEHLILESYQALLRKENLLKSISIDPETLRISLRKEDGSILANSQLSAGERQLLSISILWGLAKASSKPFPVAVDTPFGRLDSTHRTKLVSNYFIHASHQIMLFSTDEEIVGDYYKTISPNISWNYKLHYDDQHSCTKIEARDESS